MSVQSVYSMASDSELTSASLHIWSALPDHIKYDPFLARFKERYDERRDKLEPTIHEDGDRSVFNLKPVDLNTADLTDSEKHLDPGNRLMDPNDSTAEVKKHKTKRQKRISIALRVVKLSCLVGAWVLLTTALILNQEVKRVVLHATVSNDTGKEYRLQSPLAIDRVRVTLTGPFSSSNNTGHLLYVWLQRSSRGEGSGIQQNSTIWTVQLEQEETMDFSPSATDVKTLYFTKDPRYNSSLVTQTDLDDASDLWSQDDSDVTLRFHSSCNTTVPLTVSYQTNPLTERDGIIYATTLLLTLYLLIIFEIVNRCAAALLTSTLGVGILALAGERPSLPDLVSWLDVETLLLLLSMMLLVAILADTGLFDYLAIVAFEVTAGRTWPLINCLCLFTAIFSTFLDNVTTVLLMTPVTIRLCEVMQLNPVPVLMSMVIFSNVGGAATPVGDPPNVIIASHPDVLAQNINFTTFTLHMGLGILLVCVQTYIQLRFMFRDMSKLRHSVPRDIQELRQELGVWRRAAASLSSYSRDEDIVRRALEKKVSRLKAALTKREAGGGKPRNDQIFSATLAQMKQKYRIRDKQLLVKSVISLTFVVAVFFLHAIPQLQSLSLGWTAFLGALLLLLLSERDDLEPVLARVEWCTLLFFAALFVLMEVLSKLGLISWIGDLTEAVILTVNEESRLSVAIMLILWVSGIASAFVDNIPLTTMMVRVTTTLANSDGLGLPLAPLAWALSFGACLGGNGTLIGASANVVCAGVAEQHGYRFTFMQYLKIGFPIMIGNLVVASVYLLFCHSLLQWH